MTERLLLVDLENVQKLDLSKIPAGIRVMVFYGVTQKNLPEALVVQAQPLGSRLQWVKISGQGPNALDFHIAYYLGCELTSRPATLCVVLSQDTGFDPLIRHLVGRGHDCRRVGTLKDAFPAEVAASLQSDFERLLVLLAKEKNLPVRRKGLEGKVRSWFAKLTDEERAALVRQLVATGTVREVEKKMEYRLP